MSGTVPLRHERRGVRHFHPATVGYWRERGWAPVESPDEGVTRDSADVMEPAASSEPSEES